jgi:hypothetical protein
VLEFSGPDLKKAVLFGPGFVGLLVNIVVLFTTQIVLTSMGKVATPDADKLTNKEIMRIMENNKNEPFKNPLLWISWALIWLLPPWYYTENTVAPLLLGCPAWYIYQMLLHVFITCLLIYVIYAWKPHPPNVRKLATGEQAAGKVARNQVAPAELEMA